MSRRRWALALVGVLVSLVGLIYVSWPTGHIPPYDANLTRLAESDLQGYCAGETYWKSQGAGSARLAQACRTRLAGQKSNAPNLTIVQGSFCSGIVDSGWDGSQDQCLTILEDNEYWPTYDGGITNQWNRARHYPRPALSTSVAPPSSESRTGGHAGSERRNNPTHEVPTFTQPGG